MVLLLPSQTEEVKGQLCNVKGEVGVSAVDKDLGSSWLAVVVAVVF